MIERPPVLAPQAVAATSHPLASAAALEMLRLGGSAADAAVAAGAVLCVVEPWASHIGGDAFALVWDADAAQARAIQGSGIAPQRTDSLTIAESGGIPLRGVLPITVPGMVAAWFHLLSTRGRLPAEQVLAPAIGLAEDGFPAGRRWERTGRLYRSVVAGDPGLTDLFGSQEQPVREGSWVRQPDLAGTLRDLGCHGARWFYEGGLGERVVGALQERGGILELDDLRGHATEEVEPVSVELTGCTLLEQPPVSQGMMVLALMLLLDETDRRGLRIEGDDPRAIAQETHLQVEGYRRVRAYRDRFLCDPRFATSKQAWRLDHWIEREHAAGTLERMDLRRASAPDGGAAADVRDTTYLCVADGDGNIVSWIQSIFHPFGAGFVVPGTGVILNNRMYGFSLDSSSPNRLEPGKRTIHTLNSWMVLRDGRPWLVGGTPGAENQIQTNVQVLRARLAHSRDLTEALRAPRWGIDEKDRVAIEGRGPADVRRRLKRRGHAIVRIGPWDGSGFVQAIERLDGGGWIAFTDPRGEGLAVGF